MDPSVILQYWKNAVPPKYNDTVLSYIQNVQQKDPKYKKSKQVHKTIQAGVYHVGEAFAYRKENFVKSDMPPFITDLKLIAEEYTNQEYDLALFKVYAPGESLANHQDVDGSNVNVRHCLYLIQCTPNCQNYRQSFEVVHISH